MSLDLPLELIADVGTGVASIELEWAVSRVGSFTDKSIVSAKARLLLLPEAEDVVNNSLKILLIAVKFIVRADFIN
jgi:hypothetical protein